MYKGLTLEVVSSSVVIRYDNADVMLEDLQLLHRSMELNGAMSMKVLPSGDLRTSLQLKFSKLRYFGVWHISEPSLGWQGSIKTTIRS